MIIKPIAEEIAKRLHAALLAGRLAKIDIDVIRGACEVAAGFDGWTPQETDHVCEAVLRFVVEKVG
jgi:hypothetical protein